MFHSGAGSDGQKTETPCDREVLADKNTIFLKFI